MTTPLRHAYSITTWRLRLVLISSTRSVLHRLGTPATSGVDEKVPLRLESVLPK